MARWLRATGRGLFRPGPTALVGALGVVVAWTALSLWVLRPEILRTLDEGLLLRHGNDDYGHLTHRLFQLETHTWGPHGALVLGSSTTREVLSSPEELDAGIERHAGVEVETIDLLANALSVYEYAAVLDQLPSGFRGVVVATISPTIFSRSTDELLRERVEEPRLGWVSEAYDEELARAGFDMPPRTGIYAIDNHYFLLARYQAPFDHLWTDRKPYRRHRYAGGHRKRNERKIRAAARRLNSVLDNYAALAPDRIAVLVRALDAFAARSEEVRFLLLEATHDPELFPDAIGRDRYAAYHTDVHALVSSRTDARYVDLNAETLESGNFTDLVHVGDMAGKQRHTEALAKHIAADLPGALRVPVFEAVEHAEPAPDEAPQPRKRTRRRRRR